MLVTKYHRIPSVREHFSVQRAMQSEGEHDNVHRNRSGLYFPILYIINHDSYGKNWYLNVEHSDSIVQVHKRVFPKVRILLWCSWELVGMLLALLRGRRAESVRMSSLTKQASEGGKAKGNLGLHRVGR